MDKQNKKILLATLFIGFFVANFSYASFEVITSAGSSTIMEWNNQSEPVIPFNLTTNADPNYWYAGLSFNPTVTTQIKQISLPICSDSEINKNNFRLLAFPGDGQFALNSLSQYYTFTADNNVPTCSNLANNVVYFNTGDTFYVNPQEWHFLLVYVYDQFNIATFTRNDVLNVKWYSVLDTYWNLQVLFYSSYYGSNYIVGKDIIAGESLTNRNYSIQAGDPTYSLMFKLNGSPESQAINGSCGADHFYCLVGESTSYPQNASSTAWVWTCDGINGGQTVTCSEPFTNIPEYPTTSTFECGITSGAEILGCIKNAFIWAFVPDKSIFEDFTSLNDTMSKKPPIGYITSTIDAFDFSSTTPANLEFASTTSPLYTYIFTPLRSFLVIIFYFFGAVWLFRRIKDVNV